PLARGAAGADAGAALRRPGGGSRGPVPAPGGPPRAALGRCLPALPRICARGAHRELGAGAPAHLQGFSGPLEEISERISAAQGGPNRLATIQFSAEACKERW